MIWLGNHRVDFRNKQAMYFNITGDLHDPLEVAFKKDELESDRTVSWAIEKSSIWENPTLALSGHL